MGIDATCRTAQAVAGYSAAGLDWHAVQTKPRQEARAESNLRSQGVETLLPLTVGHVRHPAVFTRHIEPLFPGYLFVHCDVQRVWTKIRYTRGVRRILGTDGRAAIVDEAVIDSIRARMGDDGLVHRSAPQPGERARVAVGPLSGLVGVFDAATNSPDRVRLLLAAVNANIRIVVPKEHLQADW